MTLLNYLDQIVRLSDETRQEMLLKVSLEEKPKGNMLHQAGNTARLIYFIEKGMARVFYSNQHGKEITYGFYSEGDMVTVPESFFEGTPSNYSIELLEDCVLYSLSREGLDDMLSKFPEMEKVKSHFLLHFLLKSSHRIVALQFQNAQERYDTLQERQPSIILRAPLGHIASYLGITQETLSRIRSKKQ
ncbi:Crp/Fnr family transcriptional regulator [Belliella marina]|uniref:Crp/Fnr family transcriptional regulator n=1 Tax=Belliella marina TaxID=1644146 RepID=A0ABW4VRT9_9BACT